MHYTIERIAKGGAGIAIADGKVFFVEGALPGESGVAEVLDEKRGYGRARAVTRDCDSPCRAASDSCPVGDACDGCGFRHVRPECALALKAESVYADIRRNAHIDADIPYSLHDCGIDLDGLRRRVRLHLDGGNTGFYARGTHRVIPASRCVAIAPELREAVRTVESVAFSRALRLELQIDLDGAGRCFVHVRPVQESRRRGPRQTSERDIAAAARAIWKTHAFAGVRHGDDVLGEPWIRDDFGGDGLPPVAVFRRIGDFAQATHAANVHIHRIVRDFVCESGADSVADLYCGSGNLTFRAATCAAHVEGAEFFCDREAFEAGRRANADVMVPGGDVVLSQCDLNRGIPAGAASADVFVCDPAREGLSLAVVEGILGSRARAVLYVSCEASCLARDLVRLAPGFSLRRLDFVDMFPQTPHVETIAWMERNRA